METTTITPQIGKAYVRVLGRQLDRFIEFEFFLNDQDLCVELVMPESAFKEFCSYYGAEILPSKNDSGDPAAPADRTPGLYQAHPEPGAG